MGLESKAVKYLLAGLATDVLLVGAVILIVIVSAAFSYEGKCFNPFGLDTFSNDFPFSDICFRKYCSS